MDPSTEPRRNAARGLHRLRAAALAAVLLLVAAACAGAASPTPAGGLPGPMTGPTENSTESLDSPTPEGETPGAAEDSTEGPVAPTPAPPAPTVQLATLHNLIAASNRDGIRSWAQPLSIADLNAAVAGLTAVDRDALAGVVLQMSGTAAERASLLAAMRATLANAHLGFYAEVWSYTPFTFSGTISHAECNAIFLAPGVYDPLTAIDARDQVIHESFHAFDCVNNGAPAGALNEGAATWIYQAAFPADNYPGASFAEATYGMKLFHRDSWSPPDPNWPIGSIPSNAMPKLLDVLAWLSSADPSLLPWNSATRLSSCYDKYWSSLHRNVDFNTVWLPAEQAATQRMLADSECRPV